MTKSVLRRTKQQKMDPLIIESDHSAEFVYDHTNKAVRTNCLCNSRSVKGPMEEGQDKEHQGFVDVKPSCNVMVVDDAYYEYRYDPAHDVRFLPGSKRALPMVRVATIVPASERRPARALGEEIDPFYWFTWRNKNVEDIYNTYYTWATEKRKLEHVLVSRDGNVVSLQITGGDTINKYVVDLSQGANLIRFEAADGPGLDREDWRYQYELVNRAWIPKKVSLEINGADGSHFVRTLVWSKNIVNEPVEKAEFSLLTLGLRRGDEIQDKRTGQLYTIQGREYPAALSPPNQVVVEPRMNFKSLILAANALLVVILIGAFLRRRWKSKNA